QLKDAGNGLGHINHMLRLLHLCSDTGGGTYPSKKVFPANNGGYPAFTCLGIKSGDPAYGLTQQDSTFRYTYMPPGGALVFLDYTQADLDCFNPNLPACSGITKLARWQYPIIEALTLYGGTLEDTGPYGGIMTTAWESEASYYWYET